MSKYFKTNLKYLRAKSGIEQTELAVMLGYESSSAVSEWEKGLRIPSSGKLNDIARIFGVTLDNLMNVNLEKFNVGGVKLVPIVGTIAAGTPILAEQNIEGYFNIDNSVKSDFALMIKGDSMVEAGIFENDIVFIHQQQTLENGEIGVILIDNEATLKRFYKNNGTIILKAENSKYPPSVYTNGNISIQGKLVAVLNRR